MFKDTSSALWMEKDERAANEVKIELDWSVSRQKQRLNIHILPDRAIGSFFLESIGKTKWKSWLNFPFNEKNTRESFSTNVLNE